MKRIGAVMILVLGSVIPGFAAFEYAGDVSYSIELLAELDGVQYGEISFEVDRYWNAHEPVFTPIIDTVIAPVSKKVINYSYSTCGRFEPYSPDCYETASYTAWSPSFGLFFFSTYLQEPLSGGSSPHMAEYENGSLTSMRSISPIESFQVQGGYSKEVDVFGIHSLSAEYGYIPHLKGIVFRRWPESNGRYQTFKAGWYTVVLKGTAESLYILSDLGTFWSSNKNGAWLYFYNENRWVYFANQSSRTFWVWDSVDRIWRDLVNE